MSGPLNGVRILDCSERSASTAIAGMLLSDLGAEVIRVEPEAGDPIRHLRATNVWFRGQKSVRLTPGRVADGSWRRLRDSADVVMTTCQPWTEKPPGLLDGWADPSPQVLAILTAHPRSVEEAFADARAEAGTAAYGELLEAEYGLLNWQSGFREGPIFLAFPHAAYGAAWLLAGAIVGALYQRERTGVGQVVTTSLVDGIAALVTPRWLDGDHLPDAPSSTGRSLGVQGTTMSTRGRTNFVMNLFQCADGRWIHVHTAPRGSFERLLIALGRPDLVVVEGEVDTDPDELWAFFDTTFASMPAQHWCDLLGTADVCCKPVLDPGEDFSTEQAEANDLVHVANDGTRQLGKIVSYSRTQLEIADGIPAVGEHDSLLDDPGVAPPQLPSVLPPPGPRVGPLDGVLVVDLGFFLAGPFGTRNLADLGARVIKVEEVYGDPIRRGTGSLIGLHRGKQSLPLDLKSAEGRAILHRLVARADVVHHNQRAGAARRLEFDYDSLKDLNPRLVYCHSSGYGNRGPWAAFPAMEPLHSALAGLLTRTAGRGNPPDHYVTHMDFGAGLTSFLATMSALFERERSGKGQYMELPQTGAALIAMSDVHGAPGRMSETFALDSGQYGHAPTNALYRTSDGWVVIACGSDQEWAALHAALGLGAPAHTYADARLEQLEKSDCGDRIVAALAGEATERALERLRAAGVPCAAPTPRWSDAAVRDPELLRLGVIVSGDYGEVGEVFAVGHTIRFGSQTALQTRTAPRLGEGAAPILAELGCSPDEVERLVSAGVVTLEKD